jgi:hypothetical protein
LREIILLPFVWIIGVSLATAALPIWHEAVQGLAEISPALAPLFGNPIADVFFQFIVPSFIVIGGFFLSPK